MRKDRLESSGAFTCAPACHPRAPGSQLLGYCAGGLRTEAVAKAERQGMEVRRAIFAGFLVSPGRRRAWELVAVG